jgi:hypothetical protein
LGEKWEVVPVNELSKKAVGKKKISSWGKSETPERLGVPVDARGGPESKREKAKRHGRGSKDVGEGSEERVARGVKAETEWELEGP